MGIFGKLIYSLCTTCTPLTLGKARVGRKRGRRVTDSWLPRLWDERKEAKRGVRLKMGGTKMGRGPQPSAAAGDGGRKRASGLWTKWPGIFKKARNQRIRRTGWLTLLSKKKIIPYIEEMRAVVGPSYVRAERLWGSGLRSRPAGYAWFNSNFCRVGHRWGKRKPVKTIRRKASALQKQQFRGPTNANASIISFWKGQFLVFFARIRRKKGSNVCWSAGRYYDSRKNWWTLHIYI